MTYMIAGKGRRERDLMYVMCVYLDLMYVMCVYFDPMYVMCVYFDLMYAMCVYFLQVKADESVTATEAAQDTAEAERLLKIKKEAEAKGDTPAEGLVDEDLFCFVVFDGGDKSIAGAGCVCVCRVTVSFVT
jgi:hypothetical protein